MPSSAASGTQTATISTEHTLGGASITAAGTYVLMVDTTNMALGDALELRAKVKVLTGGSERTYVLGSYQHVQGEEVVKCSIPVPSLFSVSFTLKQTAGTGRAFDWQVVSL